jgi:hypothetical protein
MSINTYEYWMTQAGYWRIGAQVIDEDGNRGIVVIRWNDGDICSIENDAAHPNPQLVDEEAQDGPPSE